MTQQPFCATLSDSPLKNRFITTDRAKPVDTSIKIADLYLSTYITEMDKRDKEL